MTEAISAHKKMAMGITEGNVMKKGGAVKKFADGGDARLTNYQEQQVKEQEKPFSNSRLTNYQEQQLKSKKTGGIIRKFANGGAVAESKAANLPAKGAPLKPNMATGNAKIATMKKGGAARGR